MRTAPLALARPDGRRLRAALVAAGTRIAFPDWSARGWPSAGVRRDRLGGRAVTTEFYRSDAPATIGYAIVSGAPLRWGSPAARCVAHGEYRLLRAGGAGIVAWVQDGHTCVLASRSAPPATLLALAVAQDAPRPSRAMRRAATARLIG